MAAYRKSRQAVGVFYDADQLAQALSNLVKADFADASIGLLARQETIDRMLRPEPVASDNPILLDLLKTMIVIGPAGKAGAMLLSRGRLADFLSKSSHASSTAKPFPEGYLADRHAAFLREQLDAGACLMWVTVDNGEQEKTAGSVLLKHSCHQVQVHDFGG